MNEKQFALLRSDARRGGLECGYIVRDGRELNLAKFHWLLPRSLRWVTGLNRTDGPDSVVAASSDRPRLYAALAIRNQTSAIALGIRYSYRSPVPSSAPLSANEYSPVVAPVILIMYLEI